MLAMRLRATRGCQVSSVVSDVYREHARSYS